MELSRRVHRKRGFAGPNGLWSAFGRYPVLGHDRVSALLEGFAERIRAILRTTDLTTRTAEHDFWLLLPRTDLKGREVVLGRIMDIRAATKQPEGLELRLENACFTAPEDALGGEDAELVMARLAGSMQ